MKKWLGLGFTFRLKKERLTQINEDAAKIYKEEQRELKNLHRGPTVIDEKFVEKIISNCKSAGKSVKGNAKEK